jgi:hypothetical protein
MVGQLVREKTIEQPIRAAAKSTHVAEVRMNLEDIRSEIKDTTARKSACQICNSFK